MYIINKVINGSGNVVFSICNKNIYVVFNKLEIITLSLLLHFLILIFIMYIIEFEKILINDTAHEKSTYSVQKQKRQMSGCIGPQKRLRRANVRPFPRLCGALSEQQVGLVAPEAAERNPGL